MARRNLHSSRLMTASSLDGPIDQDPMSSLTNLMDVMLVFACGLIIALIANWNVDISVPSPESPNLKELEGDLEEVESGIAEGIDRYEELGTVYLDEETGQMYVVSPEER